MLTRNGKQVFSAGGDRLIKAWPEADEIARARCCGWASRSLPPCQPYCGHSDTITRLMFSADGQTLISVGGGDAIYLWDYLARAGRRRRGARRGVGAPGGGRARRRSSSRAPRRGGALAR